MKLNAEQIKKALECCKTPLASDCENCSYTGKRLEDGVYEGCVNCLVGDALSLITSQEQRIKELTVENEAISERYVIQVVTAIELDKQVKRLTEEVASWKAIAEGYQKQFEDCAEDRARLTEENERLLARNFDLAEKGEKVVIAYKKLSEENEKLLNHYFIDTTIGSGTSRQKCIEETVRKMQEKVEKKILSINPNLCGLLPFIDQIAKEMLEGG